MVFGGNRSRGFNMSLEGNWRKGREEPRMLRIESQLKTIHNDAEQLDIYVYSVHIYTVCVCVFLAMHMKLLILKDQSKRKPVCTLRLTTLYSLLLIYLKGVLKRKKY